MFSPGETICHRFIIPFVATEISKVILTYKQNDHIAFMKTITSGFEEYEQPEKTLITVAFSQEESLLFDCKDTIKCQLNVYTYLGSRAASTEITIKPYVQQYRDVISTGTDVYGRIAAVVEISGRDIVPGETFAFTLSGEGITIQRAYNNRSGNVLFNRFVVGENLPAGTYGVDVANRLDSTGHCILTFTVAIDVSTLPDGMSVSGGLTQEAQIRVSKGPDGLSLTNIGSVPKFVLEGGVYADG